MFFLFHVLQSILHNLKFAFHDLQFTFHDLQLKFSAKVQKISPNAKHSGIILRQILKKSLSFYNTWSDGCS